MNIEKSPTRPSAMKLMDEMMVGGGGHGARTGGGGNHGMRDGDNVGSGYGGGLDCDGPKSPRRCVRQGGTGGYGGFGDGGDRRSSKVIIIMRGDGPVMLSDQNYTL